MNITLYINWISAGVQARITPLTILIIKVQLEEEHASNIIRVNMQKNLAIATSEIYSINIFTF